MNGISILNSTRDHLSQAPLVRPLNHRAVTMIMTTMMIENQGDQDLRDQRRKGSIDQGQNTRAAAAATARRVTGQYDSPSSLELQSQRDRPCPVPGAWCLQLMVPLHLCLVDGSLPSDKCEIGYQPCITRFGNCHIIWDATRKTFRNISVL